MNWESLFNSYTPEKREYIRWINIYGDYKNSLPEECGKNLFLTDYAARLHGKTHLHYLATVQIKIEV